MAAGGAGGAGRGVDRGGRLIRDAEQGVARREPLSVVRRRFGGAISWRLGITVGWSVAGSSFPAAREPP